MARESFPMSFSLIFIRARDLTLLRKQSSFVRTRVEMRFFLTLIRIIVNRVIVIFCSSFFFLTEQLYICDVNDKFNF